MSVKGQSRRRLGERLLKDVYESLRAGPKWNRTMFLLVYDDIGAYFDHVIPPHEGVPAPDAPCNEYNDGFPNKFDFRRLGGRSAGEQSTAADL